MGDRSQRGPGDASATPLRYEVGDSLGHGGMGEVHDAFDRQLGRRVAIKTIRDSTPSDRAVARFLREARIQGRLEHPAIPSVHELGRDSKGRPFFVMKKLAGKTLSKLVRASDIKLQRLLRAFADVCLAVELAHVHGVVHRDLKPDNIILGEFGEVYVIDWGVAKVVGDDDTFDDIDDGSDLETRGGAVLGTPGYMAPEQARGESDIDARVDVYSLGVVLREILERDRDVPPELSVLADRATAAQRGDRLASARALAEGVQRYLDGDRDSAMRRDLAVAHLATAEAAFANGTAPEQRSIAMREAGRALALDPELVAAGDLISRLMLEPPAITPPEVDHELRDDAFQRVRANARGALWGLLAFFVFLPGLIASGEGRALAIAVAGAFAVVIVAARRSRSLSPWWIAIALTPIVVIVARMFSPTLVAPGMAAVIAGALAANPLLGSRQSALALWALMSMAVLGPLAAETLGWLSPTTTPLPGQGLMIHTDLIARSAGTSGTMRGAVFVPVLVGAGVMVSYFVRRADEQIRRRLHLQTWHVRQLFPDRRATGA